MKMSFDRNRSNSRRVAFAALAAGALLALSPQFAQADATYDFTIGPNASGFFTTGAASPVDAGYYLTTALEFTSISGTTMADGSFSLTNQVDTTLATQSAYDPTTGTFINHFAGNTYPDTGTITTADIANFGGLGSGRYGGNETALPTTHAISDNFFSLNGPLVVTAAPTAVPEPGALALFGTGLIGLALARRRRSARAATA